MAHAGIVKARRLIPIINVGQPPFGRLTHDRPLTQITIREIGTLQIGACEPRATQVCTGHVRIAQIDTGQICSKQIGPCQRCTCETGIACPKPDKLRITQVHLVKTNRLNVLVAQVEAITATLTSHIAGMVLQRQLERLDIHPLGIVPACNHIVNSQNLSTYAGIRFFTFRKTKDYRKVKTQKPWRNRHATASNLHTFLKVRPRLLPNLLQCAHLLQAKEPYQEYRQKFSPRS